jgi:hypothetical protein
VSQNIQITHTQILIQELNTKGHVDILDSECPLSTRDAVINRAKESKFSMTTFNSYYVEKYFSKNLEVLNETEAWLSIATGTPSVGIHITKNYNDLLIKARCKWKAFVINGYIEDEHVSNQEFILENIHNGNRDALTKLIMKKLIKEELKKSDLFA